MAVDSTIANLNEYFGPTSSRHDYGHDVSDEIRQDPEVNLQEPYDLLTQVLGFANKDQEFWWRTTASTFATLIKKSKYDVLLQYKYLAFYYYYILPVLGPRPKHVDEHSWRSDLTHDFSPMEPSWNLNGSKATVRFTVEPIGYQANTAADPLNRLATQSFMTQLKQALPDLYTNWFDHFEKELCVSSDDAGRVRAKLGPNENVSQTFFAFDLHSGKLDLKVYFAPMFKSLQTGRSRLEIAYEAIRRLDSEGVSLTPALSVIETYTASLPPDPKRTCILVAIDCIEPTQARIKTYIRTNSIDYDTVRDFYTLGGKIENETTRAGTEIMKELWPLLLVRSEREPTVNDSLVNYHHQSSVIISFEIRPNNPLPEQKIYIPLWQFGRNDKAIAANLSTFFANRGWSELAKSYPEDFCSFFPKHDLASSAGTHTYLSFAYSKAKGVHMTMYYSPRSYVAVHGSGSRR